MTETPTTSHTLALAAELSDVRRRGVSALERLSTKQGPLDLPLLKAMQERSPWAGASLPSAVQQMLTVAVTYVPDRDMRTGLRSLFGLDGQGGSARERLDRAARKLGFPDSPSTKEVQARIGDARTTLAEALLAAQTYHFVGHVPRDLLELSDEELPVQVQLTRAELELQVAGRGISVERIAKDAPYICALAGTKDAYRRGGHPTEAAAALAFIECANTQARMRQNRFGLLASSALNLAKLPLSREQRRSKWIEVHDLDEEAYSEAERKALIRLADVMTTMFTSPCSAAEDEVMRRAVEAIFAPLDLLTDEKRNRMLEHLLYEAEAQLAGVARGSAAYAGNVDWPRWRWLDWVLHSILTEWNFWQDQYLETVDATTPLIMPARVAEFLATAASVEDPRNLQQAWRSLVEFYWAYSGVDAQTGIRDPHAAWDKALMLTRFALRNSFYLLAQVLAFNQVTDYWAAAQELRHSDEDYAPRFPVSQISVRL